MDHDKLARRLLLTFATEVREQARVLSTDVLALEQQPEDPERLHAVFRVAHTLKGAARAAGVPLLEQLCHTLEGRLAELRRGARRIEPADFTYLLAAVDALHEAGALLQEGRDLSASAVPGLLQALTTGEPLSAPAPAVPAASPTGAQAEEQVRVQPEKLGGLLAASGDLLVERSRAILGTEEMSALAEDVSLLSTQWRSLGRALRQAAARGSLRPREQRALRTLDDAVHRVARRTTQLVQTSSLGTRSLGAAVDRLAERMHEVLLRPFSEATEPLGRAVRDLAAAMGKEVRLVVEGGEVEADRAVLDGLRDALLQLVRNAVDHGIEPPDERARVGKPRAGAVTLAARLVRDRIVVTVADDGAGLDVPRILAALEARGAAAPEEEAALGNALLTGRISTRSEATAISGRGVGLDIVRAAIERIQGTIEVSWVHGRGTTFTIECRPSLSTMHAVLVEVGSHMLAIPAMHITALRRVRAVDIREVQGRQVITTDAGPVPLVGLARVLGPPLVERPAGEVLPVVLLAHGGRQLAVAVDALTSEQEIVLRPVRRDGVSVGHLGGATILASGRVAPVLNVAAVVAAGLGMTAAGVELSASPGGSRQHRVLVVDDSITTRTLEASVMESAGYAVVTAVDGTDAWRKLQEGECDLVITDVDMPRMDGLDLCRMIRASKRFKQLPVILVSALESPEDRQRGMDLGADAYIGKSGFDQRQLLATVQQLLG